MENIAEESKKKFKMEAVKRCKGLPNNKDGSITRRQDKKLTYHSW